MKNQLRIYCLFLALIKTSIVNGQVSTPANTGASGDYVGWASSELFDLNIEHKGSAYNMNFKTNGVRRQTILSNGNVGIGNFTPGHLLDIDGGDINLNTSTKSYMIGGDEVLWHKGSPSDIYVGVDAGLSATTGSGNTMIGNEAGQNAAGGNVFIGYQAGGYVSSSGAQYDNVGIGYQALYQNEAYGCVGIGIRAGLENTTGCGLIAIGEEAALHSKLGNYNIAIGEEALTSEGYFGSNVAIGQFALVNL